MTPMQVIFLLTAAVTLGAALKVVTTRNLVHAALWLILSLFGVAVTFVLLEAAFFAVVQVVIYIGAIAILMIFAIMLTRREMRDRGPQTERHWVLGALLALLSFGGLAGLIRAWVSAQAALDAPALSGDMLKELGRALVSPNGYVIPFEVASVLLLAALVGAIYAAWDRD